MSPAPPTTGVVLLHGKWGKAPFAHAPLAAALIAAGYPVSSPTLPWALPRLYDADFATALDEIHQSVGHLRRQGCRRVILAGHSLGAWAGLAYAAQRGAVEGLMLLAPAHFPDTLAAEGHTPASLAAARSALSGPSPDRRIPVVDVNQGVRRRLRIAPRIYLSYFDPTGPANWAAHARTLPPQLPTLWVVGDADPTPRSGIDYAFALTPDHPRRQRQIVAADHAGTPAAAIPRVLAWLAQLEQA